MHLKYCIRKNIHVGAICPRDGATFSRALLGSKQITPRLRLRGYTAVSCRDVEEVALCQQQQQQRQRCIVPISFATYLLPFFFCQITTDSILFLTPAEVCINTAVNTAIIAMALRSSCRALLS